MNIVLEPKVDSLMNLYGYIDLTLSGDWKIIKALPNDIYKHKHCFVIEPKNASVVMITKPILSINSIYDTFEVYEDFGFGDYCHLGKDSLYDVYDRMIEEQKEIEEMCWQILISVLRCNQAKGNENL